MDKLLDGLSLIIPAYNEADTVYRTASEAARVLEELGLEHEIILVDDGSDDDTPLEIQRAARDFGSITPVLLPENQGKGNALKRGFQASGKELVCFLDADLDLHPSQVKNLLHWMKDTDADIVIGSKRHPDSQLKYPLIRKFYSTVYYLLIWLLFRLPIKDTQTGIKLFRREVLTRAFPRIVSKKYALDLELMVVAHNMGYRISEAPINLSFQREYGRIKWFDIRWIIVDTMAIFYRLYFLRYYNSPLKPVVPEEPRISIVIPTREVDPMAEECLRKCHELNYSNFDIKLIPDSKATVEPAPSGSAVIPSGPVGPAAKRNMGAAASDAEVIAFIDSDAWPDFNWLKNVVPYFEDETVAAVGGPAVTPANDSRRRQVSGMVYSASMVSGSTTYRYTSHALREVDDCPTCNLLVRRSDFEAVGGFGEEFWPGEDTVLCLKLTRELGKKILYVPNVTVYHHRRAVFRPHMKQVYSYAMHRGFFVRKFPETSRRLQYFVPSLFVMALVAGLVAAFFNQVALFAYLSVLSLYVLLTALSSIKSLDVLTNLLVFPGIIITHITYGIGFLRGLLARRMKEQ
ncbi:MAG: glycosyltransferase [Actinomycetia bacterium]|nr:glycosyltransferase [Actinomycetes bacterium]